MVKRAVECSIEIQAMMQKLPELTGDDIAIGIGINTGEMVMGAMGSEERMDFTVIGDAVNLGARLCSAAGRGQIIVSEYSAQYLLNDQTIELRKLDPIKVKGKEAMILIYEAMPRK
jgi:adenylate cyclase